MFVTRESSFTVEDEFEETQHNGAVMKVRTTLLEVQYQVAQYVCDAGEQLHSGGWVRRNTTQGRSHEGTYEAVRGEALWLSG